MEFETTTYRRDGEVEITIAFDVESNGTIDEYDVVDQFVRIHNLMQNRVYDIDYNKLKQKHQDIIDGAIDDFCSKEHFNIVEQLTEDFYNA